MMRKLINAIPMVVATFTFCTVPICYSAQRDTTLANTATDFTQVAKKAIPAVVSIKVKEAAQRSTGEDEMEDFFGDQFWQRFFSLPNRQHKAPNREGQASGFIVSSDGYIITSGHVVQDTTEIVVTLNDGREFPAKVIGQDSNTDIALIKIDAKGLPYLEMGDSDALEVGQWVVAIGTPLGLQATLTTGVVSAKGRSNLDLTRIEDFIQTDAPLNRGNSGGPLLDLNSKVIGINTAIASNMGGYMGIGFAVPSNIAKGVMDQLISKGSVSRGYIGVLLQHIDQNLASSFGLEKPEGILVAQVSPNSPAEKAGLMQGDIIIKYNGHEVSNNIGSLRTVIALMPPGSKINLTVIRKGKHIDINNVIVGDYATSEPMLAQMQEEKLGITVANITPEIMQSQGLSENKGVVINKVIQGSIAQWAGLRKGMVILSVNQQEVDNVDTFKKILQQAKENQPILFLVKEGSAVRFISLKIG